MRGLSTRDIDAHLQEIYGVQVGRDLISKVTDGVAAPAALCAVERLLLSSGHKDLTIRVGASAQRGKRDIEVNNLLHSSA
ncbi:MAG: transposase [Solirubrobacteraceae bacterium]